jgi:broad specificity phosphatase PhoE
MRTHSIWLARHGYRADYVDPDWRRTAKRPHDTPLSPDGLDQAEALAARFEGEGLRYVLSSPFMRAVQTAHAVADRLDLPLYIEPGACEWLRAEWFQSMPKVLSPQELASHYPRVDPDYDPCCRPAYPEGVAELVARCRELARTLVARFGGDLLVVGHGASVMALTAGLLDDPETETHPTMCAVTKLTGEDGRWQLALDGDRSHLAEIDARQMREMPYLFLGHDQVEREFNDRLRAAMAACWNDSGSYE